MTRDLVFSIPEIKEKEGLSFEETFPASEFAQEPSGSCSVRLDFSVGGEEILMEGRVSGHWDLVCSRCLAEHAESFESLFEETYPLNQGTIDAREEVRQNLLLSVPEKPLCRQDCRGLCPRCGKDLNEGPCACRAAAQ